jgi:hypothetical protein
VFSIPGNGGKKHPEAVIYHSKVPRFRLLSPQVSRQKLPKKNIFLRAQNFRHSSLSYIFAVIHASSRDTCLEKPAL